MTIRNSKLNNCLEQLFVIYENNYTVEPKQKFLIRYDRILSIQRISDFEKNAKIPSDSDLESVTSLDCGYEVFVVIYQSQSINQSINQ